MLPYSRQEITKDDIFEVNKILKSNFLTQGPVTANFEKSVAKYCKVNYAISVNSATSALHIACISLDLGPGDWLWTSANTFVASANCALYCGAKVDFVDIDPKTYNMNEDALLEKLKNAEKFGNLPKIVMPVHFAGQSCNMSKIYNLSKRYGFKIIEDASHAIGASYKKNKVGSCKYSDITVFSFHPVKIITTGEGGISLTNNKKIAHHMRRLKSHGITRDKKLMKKKPFSEIWNYQQIELGYNYRMADINAALGLSQLKRLDRYIKKRHKIAKFYDSKLRNLPLKTPFQSKYSYSSYHLYPIRIQNVFKKKTQKQIYAELRSKYIEANILYAPVHRHPYYENLGFKKNAFPEAELFHKEAICLPMFPTLKKKQQEFVIKSLYSAFE